MKLNTLEKKTTQTTPLKVKSSYSTTLPSKGKLHPTKNSLSQKIRIQAIGLMQGRLSDSIDLVLQTKQAHWNVKGPHFISLHELFDQVYTESGTYSDLIAERIAQLGGSPDGTLQCTASGTSLPAYRTQISSGTDHIQALSTAFAYFGESVRDTIAKATEYGDADTADIFTGISRSVDKNLWFLESHLECEN